MRYREREKENRKIYLDRMEAFSMSQMANMSKQLIFHSRLILLTIVLYLWHYTWDINSFSTVDLYAPIAMWVKANI